MHEPQRPGASATRATAPDGAMRSAEHERTLAWILRSGNAQGHAFAILDKRSASLTFYTPEGRATASTPVLLGEAIGDDAPPGIGDQPLAKIPRHQKITAAGRFVTEPGRNLKGDAIVWLDYDSALSLHRMRSVSNRERRAQRLASPTPADNRISYGCINVPHAFFDREIAPRLLKDETAVVYILPETRSAAKQFGFDAEGAPHAVPDRVRPGTVVPGSARAR